MKKYLGYLACILALTLLFPFATAGAAFDDDENEPDGYAASGDVTLGTSLIATDDANGNVELRLYLLYKGSDVIDGDNLEIFEVTPIVDSMEDYPFDITWTSYVQNMNDQKSDGERNPFRDLDENATGRTTRRYFQFDFKTKKDVMNGYYPVNFNVRFLHRGQDIKKTPAIEDKITVYVHIQHGKDPETPTPTPTEKPEVEATPRPMARVILKRYTMNPADVTGGDEFDLTLVLENTNADMAVRNMKCSLSEAKGYVLPESGSSSFFIESIPAKGTSEVTLRMKALPSAGVDPVTMTLAMEYDDKNASNKESEEFTLPIHQVIKVDVDEPNYPSEAFVDEPFNLMMRFYNTGKAAMYNTRVFFESDTMTADDTLFSGTVEPGGQGLFDVMITAPSNLLMNGEMGDTVDPDTFLPGGGIEPRSEEPLGEEPAAEEDGAVGAVFQGYSVARVVSVYGGSYGGADSGGMNTIACTGNVVITYEDAYAIQFRKEIPITINVMSYNQAYQGNEYDFYYGKDYDPSTGLYIDRETGLYYDPMTWEVVERGTNPLVYISIAGVAVVLLIVALVIILKVRKKSKIRKEQQMEIDAEEMGSDDHEVD